MSYVCRLKDLCAHPHLCLLHLITSVVHPEQCHLFLEAVHDKQLHRCRTVLAFFRCKSRRRLWAWFYSIGSRCKRGEEQKASRTHHGCLSCFARSLWWWAGVLLSYCTIHAQLWRSTLQILRRASYSAPDPMRFYRAQNISLMPRSFSCVWYVFSVHIASCVEMAHVVIRMPGSAEALVAGLSAEPAPSEATAVPVKLDYRLGER